MRIPVVAAVIVVAAVVATAVGAQQGVPGPRPSIPPTDRKAREPRVVAYWIGLVQGETGAVRFEVVERSVSGPAKYSRALLATVTENGPPARTQLGLVTADELPGLIAALSQLGKTPEATSQGQGMAGGPAEYRFGSLKIGRSTSNADSRLWVEAGDGNAAKVSVKVEDAERIAGYVKRAEAKIRDLEKEQRRTRTPS